MSTISVTCVVLAMTTYSIVVNALDFVTIKGYIKLTFTTHFFDVVISFNCSAHYKLTSLLALVYCTNDELVWRSCFAVLSLHYVDHLYNISKIYSYSNARDEDDLFTN